MPITPHDSSGTTFSFAGTTYTVTSITYSITDNATTDQIDVSHLGQTAGQTVLTLARPLKGSAGDTGKEVTIEYLATSGGPIAQGANGTLTIAGGVSLSVGATCKSSSVTLTVNDAVRGSAAFQVP
jgi:uncharacterized protein YcsI (UPF0317 family)